MHHPEAVQTYANFVNCLCKLFFEFVAVKLFGYSACFFQVIDRPLPNLDQDHGSVFLLRLLDQLLVDHNPYHIFDSGIGHAKISLNLTDSYLYKIWVLQKSELRPNPELLFSRAHNSYNIQIAIAYRTMLPRKIISRELIAISFLFPNSSDIY